MIGVHAADVATYVSCPAPTVTRALKFHTVGVPFSEVVPDVGGLRLTPDEQPQLTLVLETSS
jgi:hypothetical protein